MESSQLHSRSPTATQFRVRPTSSEMVHWRIIFFPPTFHLCFCSLLSSEPELKNGKRQYNRDFLLGFQFMPACVQKPEGLPPISDVVLDKVNLLRHGLYWNFKTVSWRCFDRLFLDSLLLQINQNKLPLRPDPRGLISRGPDFTPAFADFSRLIPAGRGAPVSFYFFLLSLLSLQKWACCVDREKC